MERVLESPGKKGFLSPGKPWNLVFASPGKSWKKHFNFCTNPDCNAVGMINVLQTESA